MEWFFFIMIELFRKVSPERGTRKSEYTIADYIDQTGLLTKLVMSRTSLTNNSTTFAIVASFAGPCSPAVAIVVVHWPSNMSYTYILYRVHTYLWKNGMYGSQRVSMP